MSDFDFDRVAIDATIKQEQGVFDLIRHTDTRAQAFLGLYAGFAGGVAALTSSNWWSSSSDAAKWMVALYAACLILGAIFAFMACAPASIPLPGRGANFWLVARDDADRDRAIKTFLEGSEVRRKDAKDIQDRSAWFLNLAMKCGVCAVAFGAAAVICGWR